MKVILYAACVLLSCITLAPATSSDDADATVKTDVGTFVGFRQQVTTADGVVSISKFLGIPYAEPPVGDLRFRKPVPKPALREPLETRTHGPECKQVKLLPTEGPTSEDCLYLNVYAPDRNQNREPAAEKLAVMIWIHGGAFICGSANVYVADKIAAGGDVIVVTINYRVTALGFFNVGDSNSRGNYGLWDQHVAIKWVHDHIGAFGGDPDRVTIFGESAGSGSVVYQGLYPGNKGLFQRIIAQSGTAVSPWVSTRHTLDDFDDGFYILSGKSLFQRIISQSGTAASPWASTRHTLTEAKELAEQLGCQRDNNKDIVECLKDVPADKIETAVNFGGPLFRNPFPFIPSVDGEFVRASTSDIFNLELDIAKEERATLASFDLLIGSNYAEGGTCVSPLCRVQGDPNEFMPSRSEFENSLVPFCVDYSFGQDESSLLRDLVVAEYTNWADPENPLEIREQFVAMHGDANFVAPMYATVDLYLNQTQTESESAGDLYVYHFTASPAGHIIPIASWIKKATHADDMIYVFGSRSAFQTWGAGTDDLKSWEQELSENIITMWTNFAKSGSPNKPRAVKVDWPTFTSERHSYLDISENIGEGSVGQRWDERRMNMWNNILPKVHRSASSQSKPTSVYQETCQKDGDCDP